MSETQVKPARALPARAPVGRRRVVGCYADARGAVTIFVAVWLLVIAGLASVGIDGGYWYLMRRQTQNAADMAAVAGVESILQSKNWNDYNSTLSTPGPYLTQSQINAAAQAAGAQVATANGFTDNTNNAYVYINVPPTSGPYAYQPNTVEAVVRTKAPFLLTALVQAISSMTSQTISSSSTASLLTRPGNDCLLSLNYDLTFTGSDLTAGNHCIFASDATDPTSINAGNSGGNIGVTAYSLIAAGGCYRCTPADGVITIQPVSAYQPKIADPFAILNTLDFTPMETSSNAGTYDNSTHIYTPGYFKNGIHISGNSGSFTLQSGLYILGGNGLTIDSGNSVTCTQASGGCTFVILDGGTVSINGANINIWANGNIANYGPSPYNYSLLDGMLFYQQTPSKTTGNSQNDIINGNVGSVYSGGMYFPGGNLSYNGGQGTSTSGYPNPSTICTVIIASQITMSGSGTTNVDNQACTGIAAQMPLPQAVEVVE